MKEVKFLAPLASDFPCEMQSCTLAHALITQPSSLKASPSRVDTCGILTMIRVPEIPQSSQQSHKYDESR